MLEGGHPDRARLDENIQGIQAVFEQSGDQVWNAEPASLTVTAVVLRARRATGLMGHEDVPVTPLCSLGHSEVHVPGDVRLSMGGENRFWSR